MTSLLLLHGAGSTGADWARALNMPTLSKELGFRYAAPDGRPGAAAFGLRGWDGSDEETAMLRAEIDKLPQPVYAIGHSNGAFRALQEYLSGGSLVGVVVISGGLLGRDAWLAREHAGRVLLIHGDRDTTVPYNGGMMLGSWEGAEPFLGVRDTARLLAGTDNAVEDRIDFIDPETPREKFWLGVKYDGAETVRAHYGGGVETWTIRGAGHISPAFPGLGIRACRRIVQWAMQG